MAQQRGTEAALTEPASSDSWNALWRNETAVQRLDRNWNDLLQELRVVQTGVQILTGFLLTLPFQARFGLLGESARVLYLIAVGLAVTATCLLIAPVSVHRWLFRRRARAAMVKIAHRLALLGVGALGLSIVAVIALTFLVVAGAWWSAVAGSVVGVLVVGLWLVLPATVRNGHPVPAGAGVARDRLVSGGYRPDPGETDGSRIPNRLSRSLSATEDAMAKCEVCGNHYDNCFLVRTADGRELTFDSLECAISLLAPQCGRCGCRIIGHGVEGPHQVYCCANCARLDGPAEAVDNTTRDQLS